MRNIKLIVEYDGTAYSGWQLQPNRPSIQEKLEMALAMLTGETIRINGAGRTDAGVHARGQVAAFRSACDIPIEKMARAINSRLPKDISVISTEDVPESFDPRRGAKRKLYRYTIINSPLRPALLRNFAWHVAWPLNRELMRQAAAEFVGTHDFASFCHAECNRNAVNTVRTVDRSELLIDGDNLYYEIEGRSFLYNMVRTLAGMLVEIGRGKFPADSIPSIMAARDRRAAGMTAPAPGLCLEWIRYD
jgi:tRNA pseudouridine38-40 synthase